MQSLAESPLEGIIVSPDDASVLRFQALVLGAEGTPYAGAALLFAGSFPLDYPSSPPKLRLMTTGGGTTRFGPNLYAAGRVCLSILGTWQGDPWSPSMSIGTVLLSIQSLLMTSEALRNEPGYEKTSDIAAVKFYDVVIRHHVLSIAVIDQVTRAINSLRESLGMDKAGGGAASAAAGAAGAAGAASSSSSSSSSKSEMPRDLQEVMLNSFISLSDSYLESCDALAPAYDGQAFEDPMWKTGKTTKFSFGEMRRRIADVLLPAALEVSEALEKELEEAEAM